MEHTKKICKEVYFVFFVFFSVSSGLILYYPRDELHYLLTSLQGSTLDFFFKYITYLGHGVLFAIIIVVYLFIAWEKSVAFLSGAALAALVTQTLKRIVFSDSPRPIEMLGSENIHLVEGVEMAHWHSFPSGHAVTVVSIAVLLILYCKDKRLQLVYATLSIVACFSRVYLSQHFLIDIVVGALLGILIAVLSSKLIDQLNLKKFLKNQSDLS